jgi:hypothetical protein
MALPEVERAAELLERAWAGSLPADAGGRERCRQLLALLRHHASGLVLAAERPGAVPDAARLRQALAAAAGTDPRVSTLLGQLADTAPARPRTSTGRDVRIHGTGNRVVDDHALETMAEMGLDLRAAMKPRILLLAANPVDTVALRGGKEEREIRDAIARTGKRYTLETRHAVRPADLTLAMSEVRPEIVHYSGHGTEGGALCLEDDEGLTHPVTPRALAGVFGALKGTIECVVLNACFSWLQAEELGKHARYVVGMANGVGDDAAVAFATGFYQAVGSGASIPEAVQMGRALFGLQNWPEHLLPVMLKDGVTVS